jgi:hypothetical protein
MVSIKQHRFQVTRGMPRVVGPAPANIERPDAFAPAPAGDFRVADGESKVSGARLSVAILDQPGLPPCGLTAYGNAV